MTSHPIRRKLRVAFCWLLVVCAAFVGGVYFRVAYYVYPSPIRKFSVDVDGAPSPDGPRYSAQGMMDANRAAEELISRSGLRRRNFQPHFIITPDHSGYTAYLVSGTDGTEFPSELLEAIRTTVSRILEDDFRKRFEAAEARGFKGP